MSCEVYRELLPAYLDDSLDEVRRTGFRAHLRACAGCRDFLAAREPTLLLTLAEGREPSSDRIEACVAAVVAGVRQDRLRRRLRPSRRPWLAAAAVIVIAVGAIVAWWMSGRNVGGTQALQADARDAEISSPEVAEQAPKVVEPPPRVEVEMTQDEVRIYQYAIGDDGNTGAVFIVNPAMEL